MAIGIIAAITVVSCCFLITFFRFKTKELDYKKSDSEYAQKTLKERTALELEQETTKQRMLEREKEAEKTKQKQEETKQMELKVVYRRENGKDLSKY
ncbi:MAG: hypothetical protein IJZ96_09135 [Lachnospiraceae bacterium]|nr:hypothetical protein [Lachnospiraceae bacterium]